MLILVDNRSSLQETPRQNVPTVSKMRVRPGPVPVNGMSVTMGTECDQLPTSQMSGYSMYISTDHERYKAHEVSLNVDVEIGPEK
jgi:hypothetical protein